MSAHKTKNARVLLWYYEHVYQQKSLRADPDGHGESMDDIVGPELK